MTAKTAPAKRATKPQAKTDSKPAATPKPEPAAKKLSALNAAAQVLAEAKEPLSTKELIETMAAQGLWSSPGGKTPAATLYSAILREIRIKGQQTRFKKAERGKFVANA